MKLTVEDTPKEVRQLFEAGNRMKWKKKMKTKEIQLQV